MSLDEVLNDAMDIVWDESNEQLKLIMTNVRQAKKKLDDAIKVSKAVTKGTVDKTASFPIHREVAEEASRQLEVALDQLMEFLEPMDDDEEGEDDEPEPEPKPKKGPKKKVKK